MKHSLRIVILLVSFFFVSQIIGLFIIYPNLIFATETRIDQATNETINITKIIPSESQFVESPEFEQSSEFLVWIILAILISTLLFLFLIRIKISFLWKLWFFSAVFLCLSNAFYSLMKYFFEQNAFLIALALFFGVVFAVLKILKPTFFFHNLTELFIYGGLAAIIVPIEVVTPTVIILLLLLVSIYDAYSVWKSKHMVEIAKFQARSKVFAGLLVPYKKEKIEEIKSPKKGKVMFKGVKTAILGGGDVAFPLLFSGAVMKSLMIGNVFLIVFLKSMIIPIFASIALLLLFIKGRQDRFYPALPFLTAGCLIGYALLYAVNIFF